MQNSSVEALLIEHGRAVSPRRSMSPSMRRATTIGVCQEKKSTSVTAFLDGKADDGSAALGQGGLDSVEMQPSALPKEPSVTDAAPMLANKYRIDLLEAKTILLEFSKARRNLSNGLEYEDFVKFCCGVFDQQAASEEIFEKIYAEAGMDTDANVEKFMHWYMMNMFNYSAMLNASPDKAAAEKMVSRIASQYKVSPSQLDNIKREFDKFDKDHSGFIDQEEFESVLRTMLKAKDSCDLSQDRLTRFWHEIDRDGSGEVDFAEFTEWYLKYFTPEGTDENGGQCNLIEAFYASFNPNNQRRWQTGRDSA